MNDNYSIIRAIRGPITLITLGVLFALQNFTNFGFDKTWPVLLIVFGVLSLMQRGAAPPLPPPQVPPMPPPPGAYTFPPAGYGQSSGYAQSPYAQPTASGPAKGGFGTSAPPRSTDPTSTPGTPSEGGSV